MKNLLVILSLVLSVISGSDAIAKSPSKHDYSQAAEPRETDLQTHRHYRNRDGQEVHSPSKSKNGVAPSGASAQCRDGTYSFSKHARGTCSHHGGVSNWL